MNKISLTTLVLVVICRSEDQKIKKNDNSVLLQKILEPHHIHKVDKKTDVDLKLLPHSHLIDIKYKVMEG
jgi:hypothetical protein